ncbi:MAG: T9SS type A sorting domain-containing protein [Calditrichaeota bacterium]|nr:T9SS type A sorting domain-containing protein [Calditrichota bacterium]
MRAGLFALLIYASLASAQPWQWELTAEYWQNPTNFPVLTPEEFPVCVADVTGDGLDDVLQFGVNIYLSQQQDDGTWLENLIPGGPSPADQYYATAQNLDSDPAAELVFFPINSQGSILCYQIDRSAGEWAWIARPDLLEGRIPADVQTPFAMIWGNFDHNDDEEVAVLLNADVFDGLLQVFQRTTPADPWSLSYSITIPFQFRSFYSGDFDSDGDRDLALELSGIDDLEGTMIIENTPTNLVWHDLNQELLGPGGGDLDDDGEWEFLYLNSCTVPPIQSVDGPFLMHANSLIDMSFERDLRPFAAVAGNLNGPDGHYVAATSNYFCFSPWGGPNTSRTDFRDVRADQYPLPLFHLDGYAFYKFSLGDVDGDGWVDMLGLYMAYNGLGWQETRWKMFHNIGNDIADMFEMLPVDFIADQHDYASELLIPRLGDVDGDGRAELIVYPNGSPPPGTIQIYRLEALTPNEIITRALDLEAGLPDSVTSFEAADLDGDGLVELLPVVNGVRDSYFYRNGAWIAYDVLPEILSVIRGFADWDHNGTLDIFTGNGIYLNLTPSDADEPGILQPSSFVLSVYPNPFNAQTTISFDLPLAGDVSLRLYDLLGREVETLLNERMTAGSHSLSYSATDLPSGVYFVRLASDHVNATHKLLLLK